MAYCAAMKRELAISVAGREAEVVVEPEADGRWRIVIDGHIVGRGHNRRVQKASAILHAEMDCLESAGRLKATDYRRATLYSTLSPCDMCSGTALLYGIPRIVIGENRTFRGPEDYVRSRGVELTIVDDPECVRLMREFIAARPELWNEDIGA